MALNNLEVPCIEEVVISLIEGDGDTGYTVRVPCTTVGPVSMELKLAAFKVTGEEENNLEVNPAMFSNVKKTSPAEIASAIGVAGLSIFTAAAEYTENNAIYGLEMEIVKSGTWKRSVFGKLG